jgi:hypothetical protein
MGHGLHVGESCTTAGFAERDARDFAGLYGRLAKKARAVFAASTRSGGQ